MLQGLKAARSGEGRGRRVLAAAAAVAIVAALGLAGPRARVQERWAEPRLPPDLDAYLAAREAGVPALRPGEAASVQWAHASGARTPFALVYLHGFSADRHEVEPLVSELAAELGANAYFARLEGHGRDGAALGDVTAAGWLDDVAEAVVVGARIGERVVLLGTSTGATLALWAASRPEASGRIDALVLVSPNLALADPTARVLLWPWGGAIARALVGRERCFEPVTPAQARHWTTCYPTRALLPMMAVVEHVRRLDAGSVQVPALVIQSPHDRVVDPVRSMERVRSLLGREPAVLRVEDAGDPEHHVLAGDILSPGTTARVRDAALELVRSLPAPEGR